MYSVGQCPACLGAGAVVALKRRNQDDLLFWCPSCECAWRAPPAADGLDSIQSIDDLAPEGVVLPTRRLVEQELQDAAIAEAPDWLEPPE